MQTLTDKTGLTERIKGFEFLQNVSIETIEWLVDQCEYRQYEAGEIFFEPGSPIDNMEIVVEGKYRIQMPQANEMKTPWSMGKRSSYWCTSIFKNEINHCDGSGH